MAEIEVLPAKSVGRPSEYNPSKVPAMIEEAANGGHIPSMMKAMGIKSKDTWYRWQREYPEFKAAVEQAEIESQIFYEKLGLLGMTGKIKDFNATAYIFIVSNKFGSEYKRSGSGSTEINITNNTVSLTPEQLTEKIAQKMEKLKSLGVDIEGSTT